ncbi:uncharacterized protein [Watersipora subatra]|uniref:uncharacterized protein n=1 Tax=Watersipora subatra TaxID=2589382 RepID=UPI00355C17EA
MTSTKKDNRSHSLNSLDNTKWVIKDIPQLKKTFAESSLTVRYEALMNGEGNYGFTPIHRAATRKDIDSMTRMLTGLTFMQQYKILQKSAANDSTALHNAAYKGHTGIALVLLSNLPSSKRFSLLKIQDSDGDTALHVAANRKNENTLQILLASVDTDQQEELLKIINKKNEKFGAISLLCDLSYGYQAWMSHELSKSKQKIDKLKTHLRVQDTVMAQQAQDIQRLTQIALDLQKMMKEVDTFNKRCFSVGAVTDQEHEG